MPSEPLLSVDNLTVSFGAARVLDGVSFSVDCGETLCIIGESGCGKSVTALSLMGLLANPPARRDSGVARFQGRDLVALFGREMRALRGGRLAMVFQEPMTALNPAFTIGDQIAAAVRPRDGVDPSRTRAGDAAPLAHSGAGGAHEGVAAPAFRRNAPAGDYRHGARNDPALLIADEPTTALDVTIQARVLALMKALQRENGAAMIMIANDLGVVTEVADHVAVIYADPQRPYTIGLMASLPGLSPPGARRATILGLVPSPEAMRQAAGSRRAARSRVTIASMRRRCARRRRATARPAGAPLEQAE